MAANNTTPPTVDELLKYVEARLKITVDHYVYYKNLVANTAVVENEIRMLNALKDLVLEIKRIQNRMSTLVPITTTHVESWTEKQTEEN